MKPADEPAVDGIIRGVPSRVQRGADNEPVQEVPQGNAQGDEHQKTGDGKALQQRESGRSLDQLIGPMAYVSPTKTSMPAGDPIVKWKQLRLGYDYACSSPLVRICANS